MLTNPIISPGSRVAVMGLGVSGRSAVRYCQGCGAEVLVSDSREQAQFLREEGPFLQTSQVQWEAGGHSLDFLCGVDCVLLSPGVDPHQPLIAALRELGIRVVGELAVLSGLFQVPVVAVTGTNGKTTVTSLIGEIAQRWGKRVFVGGNIGTPLYDYFLEDTAYELVVAEVSSFQLESAGSFAPDVALLLNISPDHLDRHGSLDNYIGAKMQLFVNQNNQQLAIVNGDDPHCQNLDPDFMARFVSFGAGKFNDLVIDDGEGSLSLQRQGESLPLELSRPLSGFTARNYGAASLALVALGCPLGVIEAGLTGFTPPPHRLEFIAEKNGVSYYNDSKATNTGAVLAALQVMDRPVLLIAGGRDKGDDYNLLQKSVEDKLRLLILIGEAAAAIEGALGDSVASVRADSLAEAVHLAASRAIPGDVVLLSPACASFDMFRSYGHRGDEFRRLVQTTIKG